MNYSSHPDPTLAQLQTDYTAAVQPWAANFVILNQADFEARMDVCHKPCIFWSDGREGIGHCEHPHLNCRRHKPWLAGAHCPAGFWAT